MLCLSHFGRKASELIADSWAPWTPPSSFKSKIRWRFWFSNPSKFCNPRAKTTKNRYFSNGETSDPKVITDHRDALYNLMRGLSGHTKQETICDEFKKYSLNPSSRYKQKIFLGVADATEVWLKYLSGVWAPTLVQDNTSELYCFSARGWDWFMVGFFTQVFDKKILRFTASWAINTATNYISGTGPTIVA